MDLYRTWLYRFYGADWRALSIKQQDALAKDVAEVQAEDGVSYPAAIGILNGRIGGPQNLMSYCKSLTAQASR